MENEVQKASWMEGKRKLIMSVLALVVSAGAAFGLSAAKADSIITVAGALIPVLLNIIYIWANIKTKQITIAAENGTVFEDTSPKVDAAQPASQPPAMAVSVKPPVVDTMPVFEQVDDCLIADQKAMIGKWYGKATSDPPVVPVIPKEEASLYMDIKERDTRRYNEAQNDIAMQAIKVFPGKEVDACLGLRKNCEQVIWDRINYHWKIARVNWINYGIALWKYKEL